MTQKHNMMVAPTTTADKFMRAGIAAAKSAKRNFIQTKLRMLDCGWYFAKARDSLKDGDFGDFLACYEKEVSRTSVYRWIGFLEDALIEVAKQKPALAAKPDALLKQAKAMILMSPKAFTAVWRAEGEIRRFGEYDAVKYATGKMLGNGQQLELPFEKAIASLEALELFDHLQIPEGKTETQALQELDAKLEKILAKVRAQLAEANTIET